jgi:hypothetical protein
VSPHDDYKRVEFAPGQHVEPCPVCAADAELWQYSVSETAPTTKVVMCSHGDDLGPRDALAFSGCLLYMPPNDFYKATARDAVKFWNEFAKTVGVVRRKRSWQRARVLRAGNERHFEAADQDVSNASGTK